MLKRLLDFAKTYTIVPIMAILVLLSSLFVPGFFSWGNIRNVFYQNSVFGVMAIGMTFLMITGFRDLSAGTLMGLCASLTIGLQRYGIVVSLFIPLLVGILVGLINGFFVAKVGISSFIVTFAIMFGCRGITYLYTSEKSFVGTIEGFALIGRLYIGGIPLLIIIFFVLLVVAQLMLRYTRHGRNTFATGGNPETAHNAGIPVLRVTITNFMISSGIAGFGGILMAARLNSSTPILGWPDTHLQVMTMAIVGGTKLSGGYGSMFFTLSGVLVMGIVNNIIDLMGLGTYYNTMVIGAILVLMMILDKYMKPDQNQIDVMN